MITSANFTIIGKELKKKALKGIFGPKEVQPFLVIWPKKEKREVFGFLDSRGRHTRVGGTRY